MEKQGIVMFYELCRLCLENSGAVDMFDTEDLAKDIYTFITVKVTNQDKLPQKICSKCCEVINNIKNLRSIATQNDSHLRSLFDDEDEDSEEDNIGVPEDPLNITGNPLRINIRERIIFEDDDYGVIKENDWNSNKNLQNEAASTVISLNKDTIFNGSSVVNISTRRSSADSTSSHKDTKAYRRTKLKTAPDDLECKMCQKIFQTPKKLYLHSRLHVKKMYCPLDACAKRFATKGDLEKHIRTHTGERPYQCDICKKSFAQKGTLRAHIEVVHRHKKRQKS